MRKQIITTFLFLFFCCGFANAQSRVVGHTYALVAGISEYADPAIPRLSFADKDAELFSQWLQTKAAGSVPQYNLKLLTNENATVAAFYNALDWLKKNAKENDLVYIYFSGHGDVETRDAISHGYLLAQNSPPNNYLNNAISVSDLNNTAEELTTKNKAKIILITDACHSGKMAGDFYKGRQLTAANLRLVLNNQVRIASCREDEEAAEGQGWGGGRGVFSYYLLQGLNGGAAQDTALKLESLQYFMDSCFANDAELKRTKHIQHPISDGSPLFTLAHMDQASKVKSVKNNSIQNKTGFSPGLQSLRSAGSQPIDYFFGIALQAKFETIVPFDDFKNDPADSIIFKIVDSVIEKEKIPLVYIDKTFKRDSLWIADTLSNSAILTKLPGNMNDSERAVIIENRKTANIMLMTEFIRNNREAHDTLNHLLTLQQQLRDNSYSRTRFAGRFVQMVHDKSQDMINAYLRGDLAELEKRQYYSTGQRNYRNLIPLMKTALILAEPNSYLREILALNTLYISGLTDRLETAVHAPAADSLLKAAAVKIQDAIRAEPYSAYTRNEMGNLYFQQKKYDSALACFNYASLLAPAWAVPYSNKIRIGIAENNIQAAVAAAHTADSLQAGLAFVQMNAGLAFEKTGDLLAAESYYLRATEANNVHYLPFERLGHLYIKTGDYEKADSFLYEAERRKNLFAVNESVFEFGIELGGGSNPPDETGAFINSCTNEYDSLFFNFKKYDNLINIIFQLRSTTDSVSRKAEVSAEKILTESPDIILAQHYLGKHYFFKGNFAAAVPLLKEAIKSYRGKSRLKLFLRKEQATEHIISPGKKVKPLSDSSCLLHVLLYLQYDEREDHYLLAAVYEKSGDTAAALKEYGIISNIENKMQDDQAAGVDAFPVKAYDDHEGAFSKYLYERDLDEAGYAAKYNTPILTGGTLKSAQFTEKGGRYKEAEKILLEQVKQNQSAGIIRQKKIDAYNAGNRDADSTNVYWLFINEELERQTFHFYERMTGLFPRDAYWYKNAGLFLYQRLWLTYRQIIPVQRPGFYAYSVTHAFPFKSSIEETPDVRLINNEYKKMPKLILPGTNEEIVTDYSFYDPVVKACYFLQQAEKFSGDQLPDPKITEDLADLQSWRGIYDSAILNYQSAVNMLPGNIELRNKLIDVLEIKKQFPQAAENLEVLLKAGHLLTAQKITLAKYEILQKKYLPAETLLRTSADGDLRRMLMIRRYMIAGDYAKSLSEIREQLPQEPDYENSLLYTKARLYALQKKPVQAFNVLVQLFKNGFKLFYVLNNDDAWKDFRAGRDWQRLMKENPFVNMYPENESGITKQENDDVVKKRIPMSLK